MLDFFLLERALDALESDSAQRPEAVRLPLAQALRILSHPAQEAA
jgi:hypothetical protein